MKTNKKNKQLDPSKVVTIQGKDYHAATDGSLFLDENDRRVPKYLCLCFAHEACDCVCGAWDYGLPDKYYL